MPEDQRCPVCFGDLEDGEAVMALECHPSHRFHVDCLAAIDVQVRCPLCRAGVLPADAAQLQAAHMEYHEREAVRREVDAPRTPSCTRICSGRWSGASEHPL